MVANMHRMILPGFLSRDVCEELVFIHKSCSTTGYRPHVFSTTLLHLIATNCAHLIMPFIQIRERLKETVEEFFDCHYEISVEFTGLLSWTKGAKIGWHSDDNRPYLRQRHFTVVCYLNDYDKDFKGGLFHFRDGEPSTVTPRTGDVILYTADKHNIHCVDEITDGERHTLALWFTRDSAHNEDVKLISQLSDHVGSVLNFIKNKGFSCTQSVENEENKSKPRHSLVENMHRLKLDCTVINSGTFMGVLFDVVSKDLQPLVPSPEMYWVDLSIFAQNESNNESNVYEDGLNNNLNGPRYNVERGLGFDLRCFRLSQTGFEFSASDGNDLNEVQKLPATSYYSCKPGCTASLDQPLRLEHMGIEFPELFFNSLHALQLVQFYQWKKYENLIRHENEDGSNKCNIDMFTERISCHQDSSEKKRSLNEDYEMRKGMEIVRGTLSFEDEKSAAVEAFNKVVYDWKSYTCELWKALLVSFSQWEENQMIFWVST